MNQFLTPYKLSPLRVVKDINTGSLSVASMIYRVKAKVSGGAAMPHNMATWQVKEEVMFPGQQDHEQSYCYLIIDNIKRMVTILYHIWN